jgi:hypothetical protein
MCRDPPASMSSALAVALACSVATPASAEVNVEGTADAVQ